jgi:hypothetical protein
LIEGFARFRALGVVVAGTNPLAVETVMAAVLGFESDLDTITVVGDPIEQVRRFSRTIPRPHFLPSGTHRRLQR